MPKKPKNADTILDNDPFADCVITKALRNGEKIEYHDPMNTGLPEVTVKSAPAWSPFHHENDQPKPDK